MSTLPKIIAVDFDGTLFENAWPDVGAPIEKNINKLKAEQADGAKVILWTNRVGGALDKAVNFCKEHGIHPVKLLFQFPNLNYPERDTLIPYTNPVMFGMNTMASVSHIQEPSLQPFLTTLSLIVVHFMRI